MSFEKKSLCDKTHPCLMIFCVVAGGIIAQSLGWPRTLPGWVAIGAAFALAGGLGRLRVARLNRRERDAQELLESTVVDWSEARFDKQTIFATLQARQRRERAREELGQPVAYCWQAHHYLLNPPLEPVVVESFEKQHGISLPEDYKQFITTIGNGGAGPHYGLFPFGEYDDGRKWDDGRFVGDVGQPFPFVEAWNLPQSFWDQEPHPPPETPIEEEDRMMAAWGKLVDEHYLDPKITNGAIPLCHRGCGLYLWLIVNGARRGYVWNDYRADHAGLSPLLNDQGEPVTFSDWYLEWLSSDEPVRVAKYDAYDAFWRSSHYFSESVFGLTLALGLLVGGVITWRCGWSIPLGAWIAALVALAVLAAIDRLLVMRRIRRATNPR